MKARLNNIYGVGGRYNILIPNEFSISSLRALAKQSSTERWLEYELDCFADARNDG